MIEMYGDKAVNSNLKYELNLPTKRTWAYEVKTETVTHVNLAKVCIIYIFHLLWLVQFHSA